MIASTVKWFIQQRKFVLLIFLFLIVWSLAVFKQASVNALPDINPLKVIVVSSFAGQSPTIVEQKVTYPISSAMLSVPSAISVKGHSLFGISYVDIVFPENVDRYWARARVLEVLNQVKSQLPPLVNTSIGPDASEKNWIYEYALIDKTGTHDLSQLRSIQDWYFKNQLMTIPGVSEVATIGGMVKQYQIVLDPNRLRAHNISIQSVIAAVKRSNQDVGGSVIELAEAEYIVQSKGGIQNIKDIQLIPLAVDRTGTPILLGDVSTVRLGPQMRRGVAELDGLGEVVGGLIIMRWQNNVIETINAVKNKLKEIRKTLPVGVEIIETYNRSGLIERAVSNVFSILATQIGIIFIALILFFRHFRYVLISVIIFPFLLYLTYSYASKLGVNLDVISISFLTVVFLFLVDAFFVLIDSIHHTLPKDKKPINKWLIIERSVTSVFPVLSFSLFIFLIVFISMQFFGGQIGQVFSSISFLLLFSIIFYFFILFVLTPVLMGFSFHKTIPGYTRLKWLISIILRFVNWVLAHSVMLYLFVLLFTISVIFPLSQLKTEIIPKIDEGDLVYVSTTQSSVSIGKASELLKITDNLIRGFPEVKTVFGKIGHAETATDKSPLTRLESIIQLKPKSEWREGMTLSKLKQEISEKSFFPGVLHTWSMPAALHNGVIYSDTMPSITIRIYGADLRIIHAIGEKIVDGIEGDSSVKSIKKKPLLNARYINIEIDRWAMARYGLNVDDIQEVIGNVIGGATISNTLEGVERYPINIRYLQDERDSVDKLLTLPLVSPIGIHLTLGDVTHISITEGPASISSINANQFGQIEVETKTADLDLFTSELKLNIEKLVTLPVGYSLNWVNNKNKFSFELKKTGLLLTLLLLAIAILLVLYFKSFAAALIVLATAPVSMAGSFWALYLMDYKLSIVTGVGIIAMIGMSISFGFIMLTFLNTAFRKNMAINELSLKKTIILGVSHRLRSMLITAVVVFACLLLLQFNTGTGSEVFNAIASSMIGGFIALPLGSLILIPLLFMLWKRKNFDI